MLEGSVIEPEKAQQGIKRTHHSRTPAPACRSIRLDRHTIIHAMPLLPYILTSLPRSEDCRSVRIFVSLSFSDSFSDEDANRDATCTSRVSLPTGTTYDCN